MQTLTVLGIAGSRRARSVRAQEHLKLVPLSAQSLIVPHPGVLVDGAKAKFDAEGRLTDEGTRTFLRGFMADLAAWTVRLRASAPEGGALRRPRNGRVMGPRPDR